jgi:hypothetical protein
MNIFSKPPARIGPAAAVIERGRSGLRPPNPKPADISLRLPPEPAEKTFQDKNRKPLLAARNQQSLILTLDRGRGISYNVNKDSL